MKGKRILLVATGGTIAGTGDIKGKYEAGTIPGSRLLDSVKDAFDINRVEVQELFSIDSKDMNENMWQEILICVKNFLAKDDAAGVVITHGTDTMAETAFFLEYTLDTDKPVVLTGAMRPASSLSADGPMNLWSALSVADNKESKGRGVLVVMNGEIHSAAYVAKIMRNDVSAFASVNTGAIGSVLNGDVRYFLPKSRPKHKIYKIEREKKLPFVPIIYSYAGDDGEVVGSVLRYGAKGLVYAGFGSGTFSKSVKNALDEAVKKGVKVMISSKVLKGRTLTEDKKFMSADFLTPEQARILLLLKIMDDV
ncbi:MAG: asparaginase [Selenomonadaceae bacterium]|nr:asparaginase [Selenomonadaceae bacterium]